MRMQDGKPGGALRVETNGCDSRQFSLSRKTPILAVDIEKFGATEVRFVHDDRVVSWNGALLIRARFTDDSVGARVIYDNHSCSFETGTCSGGEVDANRAGTTLIDGNTVREIKGFAGIDLVANVNVAYNATLVDNDVLDLASLPTANLNVRADTTPAATPRSAQSTKAVPARISVALNRSRISSPASC